MEADDGAVQPAAGRLRPSGTRACTVHAHGHVAIPHMKTRNLETPSLETRTCANSRLPGKLKTRNPVPQTSGSTGKGTRNRKRGTERRQKTPAESTTPAVATWSRGTQGPWVQVRIERWVTAWPRTLEATQAYQASPTTSPPPMRPEQSASAPLLTNTTPARRRSCSKRDSHKVDDAFEVILFSPHWECTDTQRQCLDRSGMRIHRFRHRNKPQPSRRAGPGSAPGARAAPPPPRGNEKHSQAICIHPQRGRREHDEARWRKTEGKASTRIRQREVNHPTHKPCTPTRNQVIMTRNSLSGPLHSRFIPYFDSATATMDSVLQTESLFVSTENDTETVEICIVTKGTNGALAKETKAQVQYSICKPRKNRETNQATATRKGNGGKITNSQDIRAEAVKPTQRSTRRDDRITRRIAANAAENRHRQSRGTAKANSAERQHNRRDTNRNGNPTECRQCRRTARRGRGDARRRGTGMERPWFNNYDAVRE